MIKKKTLPLALASSTLLTLLTLLATTAASNVQAQSSVTIYGRINVGLVNYSGYGAGRRSVTQENSFSSRIGFRGIESLGNGLEALFIIESALSVDTGAGQFGRRESSVGIKGGYGQLKLGFMLSAMDDLHGIAGPGWVSNVSNDNLNGFWGNGYSNLNANDGKPCDGTIPGTDAGNNFSFDNRYGNSIRYDSPTINNFIFSTHVSLGESNAAGCKGSHAWSSKIKYTGNGITAGIAYNQHNNTRGPDLQDNYFLAAAAINVKGSYYIGGYYQTLKYENPGKRNLKQDGFGLIGKYFLAPHSFEASWYRGGEGKGNQTPVFSGIFVGANTQANLYIVGYKYTFSRRTDFWVQYAQLRNSSASGYDLGGAGKAGAKGTIGQSPRAIVVGIRHDY